MMNHLIAKAVSSAIMIRRCTAMIVSIYYRYVDASYRLFSNEFAHKGPRPLVNASWNPRNPKFIFLSKLEIRTEVIPEPTNKCDEER
jgi:hypothetical protein